MSKKLKVMPIIKLLEKYNLYTKQILEINYHMSILDKDANYVVMKVLGLSNLPEKELAELVYGLILKCDAKNNEYDSRIDEEMIRIGLSTNLFYGKKIKNWTDDNSQVTSLYDDFQDSDFIIKKR